MKHFGSKINASGRTEFRVWAPLAIQVDVVGDFNSWQADTFILQNAGNGFWEGESGNISANDKYKYIMHRRNGRADHRIDPATRETDNSDMNNAQNHGHVVDINFNWSLFTTPSFDDMIIYQCHIGSFCGRNDGMHRGNSTSTFNDVITKLDYIRSLGFNTLALLPVQEYRDDRSWGYNPSLFFALESAYGGPIDLKNFVNECHKRGLAVIFDVVYNHISNDDSSFWHFDDDKTSSYLSSFMTPWGWGPAFWQDGIKDFFLANMFMYFDEYKADGLRFDATRYIEWNSGLDSDGWKFMQHLTWFSKLHYPDKYLIAEHVPSNDTIIDSAGFHATWFKGAYDNFKDALKGYNPVNNLKNVAGLNSGYGNTYSYSWNLIKYLTGSHDECGDMDHGKNQHRYYIESFGGRDNWYARAKTRMAWAVNTAIMGTPMMFMGNECYMWGYWHDTGDENGDHRFDWSIAGDKSGWEMRRLVSASNNIRSAHPSLRKGFMEITHEDHQNNILAFKRWNTDGDVILVIVNAGDSDFRDHSYGVAPRHSGRWQQILCTQDEEFGGWDGAGNAFYEPYNQADNLIYINIPKWSVLMFKLI